MKKIIAVFCSIAICFCLVVSAFAEETSSLQPGNYWDRWAMYNFSLGDATGDLIGAGFNFIGKVISKSGESTCPFSDDHLHHGNVVRPVRGGSSASTYTMECKCDYCGETFTVVKTSEDLSAAYDAYVSDLPASGYTSSGKLLWQPKISDIVNLDEALLDGRRFSTFPSASESYRFSVLPSGHGFSVSIFKSGTNSSMSFNCTIKVPFSGIYQRLESIHVSSHLQGDFFIRIRHLIFLPIILPEIYLNLLILRRIVIIVGRI